MTDLVGKINFNSEYVPWPKARIKGNRLQNIHDRNDIGLKNAAIQVEKILDLLVDPRKNSEKISSTTLVLGQIQSGKTSSLIAAISGAIDTGYPLIFLLGGTKGNLFDQTFKDVISKLKTENDDMGERDWANFETISDNPIFNDEDKFRSRIIEANRWYEEENYSNSRIDSRPTLIAGLKEWRNLDKLINSLKPHMDLISNLPILIIDDEADEVGINTSKKDNVRSSNNQRLNELRMLLPWQSYLAYTATPQANMVTDIDDVLSPDRVVVLKSGEDYVGVGTLFPSCLDMSAGKLNWYAHDIPENELIEARNSKIDSGPIKSFKQALSDFIVRLEVARSDSFKLRNGQMLINPHANTDPHNQYEKWVNEVLNFWKQTCDNGEFEELWDFYFEKSFNELKKNVRQLQPEIVLPGVEYLKNKIHTRIKNKEFEVQKINATKDGVNLNTNVAALIAVGGNILGRGLQFPNLLVTYMPRSIGTGTTDTIQQRGRFFGYRRKYISLLKGWFDQETRELYEGYSEFEPIFRQAMQECQDNNLSPKEWPRNFHIPIGSKLTRDAAIRLQISRLRNSISLIDQSFLFNKKINSKNKACISDLIENINHQWQETGICPVSRLKDNAWSDTVSARPTKNSSDLENITEKKKNNLLKRENIFIYSVSIDFMVNLLNKWEFNGQDRKQLVSHIDHLMYLTKTIDIEKQKLGLMSLPIIFMRGNLENKTFSINAKESEMRMPSKDQMEILKSNQNFNYNDLKIGGGLLSDTDREWILNCPVSLRIYSTNVSDKENSIFDTNVPAILLEAVYFKNQVVQNV